MKSVNFAMFIHNHQPVGNFDKVFHQSCDDCYAPLLEVLAEYPEIRLTLHYSGSLLEWIEANRPEIADRIAGLVAGGQVELMGSGFYEPILTMLTEADRQGQIRSFTAHLKERYGAAVRGLWLTERVWEQSLVSTLADAGIEYTALDDSHFHTAGIANEALTGSFITEDCGRTLRVFPGSERLRYIIPFHDVEETISYLGSFATEEGRHVVAYADDGEKFGIWPKTLQHVYEDGWLRRWLDALRANAHWIRFITGSEAIDGFKPAGRVYLPDASYREMMEWALPAATLSEMEDVAEELKELGLGQRAARFLRGGTWRNFRVKYPELSVMYAKMMRASAKVNAMTGQARKAALLDLYRGQCNCAWWHGVFGGLYLPHLRRGIKAPLIRAEAAADKAANKAKTWLTVDTGDFDFDGNDEISVGNPHVRATFKPSMGGHLIEYSSAELGLDFADTLARRKEAYHRKVFKAAESPATGVKSIHDISVLKEKGLEKLLQYDWYPRRSFMEHLLGPSVDVHAFARCDYHEMGDFTIEPYQVVTARRRPEHAGTPKDGHVAEVTMRRDGGIYRDGRRTRLTIEKTAVLSEGDAGVTVNYSLLAPDGPVNDARFAVQLNTSLVSGGDWGCYYRSREIEHGDLLKPAVIGADTLDVIDEAGNFEIHLSAARQAVPGSSVSGLAGQIWIFPVQTVSQSESGFERVLQSVAMVAVWAMDLAPGVPSNFGISYLFRPLQAN